MKMALPALRFLRSKDGGVSSPVKAESRYQA